MASLTRLSARVPPIALVLCGAFGCSGENGPSSQSSGSGSSSSGGSSQSNGAGSTGGSTGTGTAGGTGTGGFPTFVDGGYVFCTAEKTADAGGGRLSWMCPAGTYFCGIPESCSQCLSDADCTNQALPTYDPKRTRCDLDSGVRGYQGFCQQCLGNPDCAGDPTGVQCDLDPFSAVAPIDAFGFETCAVLGLGCPFGTQAGVGGCQSGICATDQDCVGVLSRGQSSFLSSQQLEPYCVAGQCSAASNSDFCPSCYCSTAATCSGPVTSDAGEVCDPVSQHCACTSSAQCGGFWPVCELSDGGETLDGGEPLGACGCDRDDQCGDGGLECLLLPFTGRTNAGPACALPCDDPRFPACAAVDPKTPICDLASGLCVPCDGSGGDAQCQAQSDAVFEGPLCRLDGTCGCQTSADCRDGEVCGGQSGPSSSGAVLGTCVPPTVPCTPAFGAFCDWDSGVAGAVCLSDYQCASQSGRKDFCDLDSGVCLQCRDDSDCAALGLAASRGLTFCAEHVCQIGCESDQDCVGNPGGPHCEVTDGGALGACVCREASECPAGGACHVPAGNSSGRCETGCTADADCGTGFFCDFYSTCRSRCDPGNSCHAPDLVCDRDNVVGFNGLGNAGAVSGAVWCYPCLDASQCSDGLGCSAFTEFTCGLCGADTDCRAGEICGRLDSRCHSSCDAGACPSGQVCATLGLDGGLTGDDVDVCYQCLSAADCSGGQGCDPRTRTCGSCEGPTAKEAGSDCPPASICSSYWLLSSASGVCLQNCDWFPCAAGETCAVFRSITPDHKYCFGCTQDSDCADAGTGAWCDTSVGLTFTCQPPPR